MARLRIPLRSRLAAAGGLALLAALALAGTAVAVPPAPSTPADDAVVGLRPTFGWTHLTPAFTVSRYEVIVELPSGPVEVARTATGTFSATSQVALPNDTRLRWFVRAVGLLTNEETPAASRWHIQVATPPGAPAITAAPPAITSNAAPLFRWSGERVSSRWSILNAAGSPVRSGELPSAGGQVVPAPLPDGSYQFRVVQRNLVDVEGPPAAVGFSIDTGAPGPLTLRRSTAKPDSRRTPTFAWTGLERGAVVTWRVLRASGAVVQGPGTSSGDQVTPKALPAGSYVFEARQSDIAGNAGPLATDRFVVLPRLAPGIHLPMRNVRRLSPDVGATVAEVRPTLRWTAGPKGTRVYNVQVFRVAKGAKLRKILSAFPHLQRYVPPRKKALTRGACYVWRVWPFRGSRPTPTPLGVSHFCVRPA
jgi:hypothetical protein